MTEYKKLTEKEIYEKLKRLAAEKRKLQIICHVSPDGDCIGSSFALKTTYERMGGEADVLCSDPAPAYLGFIMTDEMKTEADENAVLCSLDVSNRERLGSFAPLADKIDFMIDHHGVGEPFADGIVKPEASATGEMLVPLYKMQREELGASHRVAMQLYAAISSDTGSFKYSNTTKETFSALADVIDDVNLDPELNAAEIARRLHDCKTKEAIRAEALAYANLKFAFGGKLAYTTVSAAEMKELGISEGDTGAVVDIPRSVEGVVVGFTVKEKGGAYKLSVRSNDNTDVAAVCAKFGGGGHRRAAGATIGAKTMEEAVNIALEAFGKECFT